MDEYYNRLFKIIYGGIRFTMFSKIPKQFKPVLALIQIISSFFKSKVWLSCSIVASILAVFKSILFITGITWTPSSKARKKFAIVCACTPWVASTTKRQPWQACNERDTS